MENSILESLEMAKNKIGDDGACQLADLLTKNSTLRSVVLAENKIGNDGVNKLVEAVSSKTVKFDVNLFGNIAQVHLRKSVKGISFKKFETVKEKVPNVRRRAGVFANDIRAPDPYEPANQHHGIKLPPIAGTPTNTPLDKYFIINQK